MSMLMLLAIVTYGRLESFRQFAFVQFTFKKYMEKTEREFFNEEAIKRYKSTVATSSEESEKEERKTNSASSTLSFNLFVDKEQRESNSEFFEHSVNVAKNLMIFLYGEQPFFQEIAEKRPDFLTEIIEALIRVTDNFTEKEKLKKKKELATIDLGDEELNRVFTKMLAGTVDKKEALDNRRRSEITEEEIKITHKPEAGYYSLLDFITIGRNKLQIRVFLASPQLLMAIYGNPDVVTNILQARYQLYRELKNKQRNREELSQDFKTLFQNLKLSNIPESLLDFGVSLSNPRYYE